MEKLLEIQSRKRRTNLPMFWDKLSDTQKDLLCTYPDFKTMSDKKLKSFVIALVKNSNHFQSMVYANENNKPIKIIQQEREIMQLKIEIHNLRMKYDTDYQREYKDLPF